MASAPLEKLKSLWNSQVMDEEQWAVNYRVLKAAGIFAGSIFFMRNFGDLMEDADFTETDILAPQDGYLICFHDVTLDATTDIVNHTEFAGRKRTYEAEGADITGKLDGLGFYFKQTEITEAEATLHIRYCGLSTDFTGTLHRYQQCTAPYQMKYKNVEALLHEIYMLKDDGC